MPRRRIGIAAFGVALALSAAWLCAGDVPEIVEPPAGEQDEASERAEYDGDLSLQVNGGLVVQGDEIAEGELQGSVSLPEDSGIRRRLGQGTRLAANGRVVDAAQALGRTAEAVGEADVFIRVEQQGRSLRSAKAEAQRLIGELPPEGRAAYESAFGPPARRMLDESPADPAVIRRVANLYLHTAAGAEALYRLAAVYRDQGAFAEAAACLDRLRTLRPDAAAAFEPRLSLELAACRLRSGDRAGAEAALAEISRGRNGPVLLAGQPLSGVPLVGRLAEVAGAAPKAVPFTPHPADADTIPSVGGDPLLAPRWSVETGTSLESIEAAGRRLGATIPAGVPSIVGELVLRPTPGGFVAHRLATGEALWSYGTEAGSVEAGWTDMAHGRLSTDGRAVFLVEEETSGASPPPVPTVPAQIAQQQAGFFPVAQAAFVVNAAGFIVEDGVAASALGPSTNVLTALDVTPPRQGNRLWRVGGMTGGDEPRLTGHCFLGPPLAAHGRLYAIAERGRVVRLVVIEAATGRLDWSLELGRSEVPVSADPQRQQIGATPTLTRGVLVCPSAGGSVVAVDLAGRSLLWGMRFPRSSPPAGAGDDGFVQPQSAAPGWADGIIRIAGGRILVTPPEAEQLFCLDLRTGRTLWERGREEGLFVEPAGERAVLVGRSGIALLNLADGSPAAPPIPFRAGVVPSGRGYTAGDVYAQPLSDGSLMRVSVRDGSTAVMRPARGLDLGNLAWHEGAMLSLGPGFLRAFDDRDRLARRIEETLRARPDDLSALLRRADLHAEAGRYAEAIADCLRAYERERTPQVKNRLVAALLDGVRNHLPDTAAYDAELDRLAEAE
jgi:tetratricopeptide (TPR) repeat protein/outer membrane protein assembly factor BamB